MPNRKAYYTKTAQTCEGNYYYEDSAVYYDSSASGVYKVRTTYYGTGCYKGSETCYKGKGYYPKGERYYPGAYKSDILTHSTVKDILVASLL